MLVDNTGLGKSFFYAMLPNESGLSYKTAISSMKEMCPGTSACQTIFVDRSLTQYNAFRESYPSAAVIFCRFHVLKDMKKRCHQLVRLPVADKQRLFQWMRNMLYANAEESFSQILRAIEVRRAEAFGYLERAWLPYKENWAGYVVNV
ncbi:hypothetical protein [Streptococcus dysgalactiae]|uniref:hypothetical protein n=1 Tax=Streptococcus dysgalactiae TaxID=1334 RepID=UPI003D7A3CDF